jgi:hypothetical protein
MDIERWIEMLAINISATIRSKKAQAKSIAIVQRSKEVIQKSQDRINSALMAKKRRNGSNANS